MIKPTDTYWELRAGEVAPDLFFPLLPSHFPEATTPSGCGFARVEPGASGGANPMEPRHAH